MIDLHTHTARCGHAEGSAYAYVERAAQIGVDTIAITDHLPLPASILMSDPRAQHYAMPESQLSAYVAEVGEARTRAEANGGPRVLLGIEADHIPGEERFSADLLSAFPFDVVLGSVHMIDGWTFDDPDRIDGYQHWDIGALWDRYFEEVSIAAGSGLYDVLGHVDLVKKFRFFPEDDLHSRYVRLAETIGRTGVAVEVNTAGLRKPCAELYPSAALLREFRLAGVPVTIGSDAHTPDEVGFGYDSAVDALRAAGYDSVLVFENRVAQEVGL